MGLFTSCFGEADEDGGRRVTKAMIGTPSNFVHTGHLGMGTETAGKDADKVKTLMSQVRAALDEEALFEDEPKMQPVGVF
ncbi:hypothetical protein LPJ63_004466 [Coemansia sp. RSA 2711]|nr:hypothetical protein LPJ63_004466 [Coemansia sp. RSA 2711]KAJ2318906.1 hypothetical protein IWW52_002281 [Coemansia sp. RSA 2704]KAJ2329635.1 hypothetical protein IWW51_000477 [Coemansia sp. RSA 2702]